jgi:CTP synthase (UTP-ammonia lyase)
MARIGGVYTSGFERDKRSPVACTPAGSTGVSWREDAVTIRIGILGDFNPEFRSHHAINSSLQRAAQALGVAVESQWVSTPSLAEAEADELLAGFHGIWASSGSPYKSFDGMLRGIQFARQRNWPFVGT